MSFPSQEKSVFKQASDKRNEATIASAYFKSRYWEYEIAYKEAGDRLVKEAIEGDSLFLSVSVYPITFLYRQFIELYLKDLIRRFVPLSKNQNGLSGSHDLYALWHCLLDYIKANIHCYPRIIRDRGIFDILIGTDAYIAELSAVDRKSMAFRYPDDKRHENDFFKNEVPIDLINLKDRIEELANFLCTMEEYFAYNRQLEDEAQNDML